MGQLFAYSGTAAKIRALSGKLLKREDYLRIADTHSVPEALGVLQGTAAYREILPRETDGNLHREQLEMLLHQRECMDFAKLYRFCSGKQRALLDYQMMRYEVHVLKVFLRSMADGHPTVQDLGPFETFFRKHSDLDLDSLRSAHDLSALTDAVKGSRFYPILDAVRKRGGGIGDYNSSLDYAALRHVSELKNSRDRETARIASEIFGVQDDLRNILTAVRGIRYFGMSEAELADRMLPAGAHLRKKDLEELIRLRDSSRLQDFIRRSWYGRHYPELTPENAGDLYSTICRDVQHRLARQDPWSCAVLVSYLFDREDESFRIISVIECVRYGLDAREVTKID